MKSEGRFCIIRYSLFTILYSLKRNFSGKKNIFKFSTASVSCRALYCFILMLFPSRLLLRQPEVTMHLSKKQICRNRTADEKAALPEERGFFLRSEIITAHKECSERNYSVRRERSDCKKMGRGRCCSRCRSDWWMKRGWSCLIRSG